MSAFERTLKWYLVLTVAYALQLAALSQTPRWIYSQERSAYATVVACKYACSI